MNNIDFIFHLLTHFCPLGQVWTALEHLLFDATQRAQCLWEQLCPSTWLPFAFPQSPFVKSVILPDMNVVRSSVARKIRNVKKAISTLKNLLNDLNKFLSVPWWSEYFQSLLDKFSIPTHSISNCCIQAMSASFFGWKSLKPRAWQSFLASVYVFFTQESSGQSYEVHYSVNFIKNSTSSQVQENKYCKYLSTVEPLYFVLTVTDVFCGD